MSDSDRDLAQAFVQGAAAAVRAVDMWIGASLWSFRRRMPAAWEDVAQDVRLELLKRLRGGEFRGEAGLKTYVWRVTTHAAITRLRRDSVRRADPLDDLTPVFSTNPTALDQVLKAESDAMVHQVLAGVGAPCRDLWRALLAGRSYAEISEETGVSEGALRVRALRCRRSAVEARERLGAASPETKPLVERPS